MIRIWPDAIAGFALAAPGFSSAVQAQCWFNGDGVSCAQAASPPNYSYGGTHWDEPGVGYYHGRISGPYAEFGAVSHMGPDPGGSFYYLGAINTGHTD